MQLLDSFPIVLVDDELHDDTAAGRATRTIIDHLRADGVPVITASTLEDAEQILVSTASVSCLLLDWDVHHAPPAALPAGERVEKLHPPCNFSTRSVAIPAAERLIELVRARNSTVPIFLLADRSTADVLPAPLFGLVTGFVWKLEDTPQFISARVQEARREYLETLLPPFFKALVEFVGEARYSWHTPGHSGGTAFLKTPVGSAFHEFFGENTLRSDLSVSVGELGSLLEHTGPVGAAEAQAAQTFGAEKTLFVTNGTSTANKIVFHACVRPGEVVLVDRNCHKSIMHAIVMTGAIPAYLLPARNAYGIIGPIPSAGLTPETVKAALAANPLVPEGTTEAALAVVTNSTYDGLCYDTQAVLDELSKTSKRALFDEAWYGYAHFHPLYAGRHAMGVEHRPGQAATFATQSTHKLLAAFSQASMVHLHDPGHVIPDAALEEAFMMHTSTSPQYGIIASLDVSSRMMAGAQGTGLVDDAIREALSFRRELAALAHGRAPGDWQFDVWQPPEIADGEPGDHLTAASWELHEGDAWHGYAGIGDGHALLDPIKVTILTPGIAPDGVLVQHGIPAAIVTHFLNERGIVVEKTGSYSFLVLFSLGITKGKWGTLLLELEDFKRLYGADAPLSTAMPRLVSEHPDRYGKLTLRQLAAELHEAMRAAHTSELQEEMYAQLPEIAATPAMAYRHLVAGGTEMVPVTELSGRVSAAMVVPYPPGIPVLMPGERFGDQGTGLIRYLAAGESIDARFPGFETEIHGVEIQPDGSYRIPCLGHHVALVDK